MFEWDEAKNLANIEKHGISFERAVGIYSGFVVSRLDERHDYGEVRHLTLGEIEGALILAVVHTDRDQQTRIISARRANRAERKVYDQALRQRTHN